MQEAKSGFLIKYHFWFSLAVGVLFLVVLQTAVNPSFSFARFMPWLFALEIGAFFYNKAYLKAISQYTLWKAMRIPLLIFAGACLFVVMPTPFLRGWFLLAGVGIVAFFQSVIGSFSENFLLSEILFSAFAVFLGGGGFAFLYTPQNRFYVAIAVFFYVILLSRCFFEYAPVSDKTKLVASMGVGLLASEMFWVTGFLPQHFSAIAVLLAALYNLSLVVNFHFFFNNLDLKKVQFHILFSAACIILVFLFTPWRILS
jgi:hypothetical protein